MADGKKKRKSIVSGTEQKSMGNAELSSHFSSIRHESLFHERGDEINYSEFSVCCVGWLTKHANETSKRFFRPLNFFPRIVNYNLFSHFLLPLQQLRTRVF